jgi:tetratricopeptide (TPR) repeat protein
MASRIVSSLLAGSVCGALLAVAAPLAEAQRSDESDSSQRRATPTIREQVYDRLAEAQQCTEADDFDCARELLEQVRAMRNLSGYEAAQMWNVHAALHVAEEDYPRAIAAFENVLVQPDLPLGIEQSSRYALSQLYGQQERYAEALAALEEWFAITEMPSAEAYMLKARYHYLLMEYREAVEPAEWALQLATEQGLEPQESWYQLLQVVYYELENYSNVIRVATTLTENWPKKQHVVTLAGVYGQQGRDLVQLSLYEAAYEAGWLESSTELATLAQMLLQAEIPYKAARILEQGLEDGRIASTQTNWRLLAQAWVLAQEDARALPALTRASALSSNGELDMRLANAYANLARWDECVDAAESALERGGFDRTDQLQMTLGSCLFSLQRFDEAKAAFRAAARDDRSREAAGQWLSHAEAEQARVREMDRTRRMLRR